MALRLVPVLFGSLLIPTVYKLMKELGAGQLTALLAAILLVLGKLQESGYLMFYDTEVIALTSVCIMSL